MQGVLAVVDGHGVAILIIRGELALVGAAPIEENDRAARRMQLKGEAPPTTDEVLKPIVIEAQLLDNLVRTSWPAAPGRAIESARPGPVAGADGVVDKHRERGVGGALHWAQVHQALDARARVLG